MLDRLKVEPDKNSRLPEMVEQALLAEGLVTIVRGESDDYRTFSTQRACRNGHGSISDNGAAAVLDSGAAQRNRRSANIQRGPNAASSHIRICSSTEVNTSMLCRRLLSFWIAVVADTGAWAQADATGPVPVARPVSSAVPLSPRGLDNIVAATRLLSYVRFFHPSDEATRVKSWGHAAIALLTAAEPAPDAADLAARLQEAIAPLAPTLVVWAGGEERAPPLPAVPDGASERRHWRHYGAGVGARRQINIYTSVVERSPIAAGEAETGHAESFVVKSLGAGVSCRLPVQVYASAEHTLPHSDAPSVENPRSSVAGPFKLTALDRMTRLASVALCWGVMQHFYPYFDVVSTDWDAALGSALRKAAVDTDERAFLFTLRALVAKLNDGHGSVSKPDLRPRTMLPLALSWAGDDLVVIGKAASVQDVQVGDAVMSLDDKSVADHYADVAPRISAATEGWRRWVALSLLAFECPAGKQRMAARLRRQDGSEYDTTFAMVAAAKSAAEMVAAAAPKPANGAEIAPGVVYFDLDGAETSALSKCMSALAAAKGIVFDLRGYPGSAGYELMQHLIDSDATSARWIVPIVTRPDREDVTWDERGRWELHPVAPRLRGHIAFLADGRAISYAESVMGIVEHYKMGEIVGATTAGTNGNVNPFELPGGYTVVWTGMKVLKHDGSRHHGVGIAPTVPVVPTAKGIAEGRDEVLERAVAVLQAKIGSDGKDK